MQILSTPGTRYSLHDDLIFTVRDSVKANDPVTYPDYRYICDVYNNTELVARLKAYPDPTTKIGEFNISDIMRNYVTPVLNPTVFFQCQVMGIGDWNVSGTCIFGEEYGFTQYLNVSGDTGRRYYNHYNGRKVGVLTALDAVLGKPATAKPNNFRWKMNRESKFHFIPFFKQDIDLEMDVLLYNSAGNNIAGAGVIINTGTNNLHILNIADQAQAEFWGFPPLATFPNAAYMTLSFPGANRFYTVDLVCDAKHTTYPLHFLNRYGGWETQEFAMKSVKTIDIEKSEFGKKPYTLTGLGIPQYYNSNNVYNEQRSVFASQYREKMLLNTDILSDDHFEWLQDLLLSPMVYTEMVSGSTTYFIPVVITDTNYEVKKYVSNRISNLSVNIEFGDQLNAQYR